MPDSTPYGFEFASPNIIAIASLNASLKWLEQETLEAISHHKNRLMQRLVEKLKDCDVQLYLPADLTNHTSVLSFNIPEYEANEVGIILNEDFDIAVRTGYHCAPYIHQFLKTVECKGTVRVSLGYFNTEDDVDALVDAVKDIVRG